MLIFPFTDLSSWLEFPLFWCPWEGLHLLFCSSVMLILPWGTQCRWWTGLLLTCFGFVSVLDTHLHPPCPLTPRRLALWTHKLPPTAFYGIWCMANNNYTFAVHWVASFTRVVRFMRFGGKWGRCCKNGSTLALPHTFILWSQIL